MKTLNLIFAIFVLSSFYGCNKEDKPDEIGIKKKDASENKVSETGNFTSDKNTDSGLLTITSNEVKQHIGDSLRIKGMPADIFLSDKVAYLNFEDKFPKNPFSCVIFESRFSEFGDLSRFKNKNVIVTGKVTTYKNKPQVILNSKDQIKIISNE